MTTGARMTRVGQRFNRAAVAVEFEDGPSTVSVSWSPGEDVVVQQTVDGEGERHEFSEAATIRIARVFGEIARRIEESRKGATSVSRLATTPATDEDVEEFRDRFGGGRRGR